MAFCTLVESCVIETAVKFARIVRPSGGAVPAALMERFRHRPVIVLSPHFDDACFSLGGFLKALGGGGVLINLFTHGRYVVRPRLARAGLTPGRDPLCARQAKTALSPGNADCGVTTWNAKSRICAAAAPATWRVSPTISIKSKACS